MDSWLDILNEAQMLIPYPQFKTFSTMFSNLHAQLSLADWNETAVAILQMIATKEIFLKRFCKYILSLGLRLSDELYFLTIACELLPHAHYLHVQILTCTFLREAPDEYTKSLAFVDISNIVCQYETLKHWLLQLTRVVFPNAVERYEILLELGSALNLEKISALLNLGIDYRNNMTHLDDDSKIKYLRSVADLHIGNNYYLMNRYMVFVTGGEFFIGSPGTPPLQNPALFIHPGENSNFVQPLYPSQMPPHNPETFVDPYVPPPVDRVD